MPAKKKPDLQPIHTAPRDRWIMLHDGGWIDRDTGAVFEQPAVARWVFGNWEMRSGAGRYLEPTWWSEIPEASQ